MSTDSRTSKTYRCKTLITTSPHGVDARQQRIHGFDQRKFSASRVVLVGAGGINGEIAEGLTRKGIGRLDIFDGDVVDVTNLNRQRFSASDLYKNKAVSLARNLRDEGYMGTVVTGHPYDVQQGTGRLCSLVTDLVVCGVDNDPTRVWVARQCVQKQLPVLFIAVSRDADQGYVFVQEPSGPCFGCLFPESLTNDTHPCPGIPAIKDILKLVGGLALFAVDTVLMERRRNWNFRLIRLGGFLADQASSVTRRSDCPICHTMGH